MLTAKTVKKLEGMQKCSENGHLAKDLFQTMMNCDDLWVQAYINIQSNKGAMTKGVDGNTIDGMSEERLSNIRQALKEGKYRFSPASRKYIPKANGKTRPLGIPTADDKIVQEVVRIILEAIYDSAFSSNSHGFRKEKSCHTALKGVQKWSGTVWFLDVDIEGYFDNMDHDIMIRKLEKKIDDKKFIKLIKYMLKAGYLEDWKFHKTYSGTPQGGVISPILANIYLNDFDHWFAQKMESFTKGKERRRLPEIRKLQDQVELVRVKIENRKKWLKDGYRTYKKKDGTVRYTIPINIELVQRELDGFIEEFKVKKAEAMANASADPFDPNFRRLKYVRYADDFLIGMIGSRAEAEELMAEVRDYLSVNLKLKTSDAKTKITNSKDGTRFLGYDIVKSTNKRVRKIVKEGYRTHTKRASGSYIKLMVPVDKIRQFGSRFGDYENMQPKHRNETMRNTDLEILNQYNAEYRGFAQYYALADDVKRKIGRLEYLVHYSWFKTLASKYQSSVAKMYAKYSIGRGDWGVKSENGVAKMYKLKTLKKPIFKDHTLDTQQTYYSNIRTQLEQRMAARTCEYCGTTDGSFEVHHVRAVKDLKGKERWKQIMISKQRKTLVLCVPCHDKLHSGKLADNRYSTTA